MFGRSVSGMPKEDTERHREQYAKINEMLSQLLDTAPLFGPSTSTPLRPTGSLQSKPLNNSQALTLEVSHSAHLLCFVSVPLVMLIARLSMHRALMRSRRQHYFVISLPADEQHTVRRLYSGSGVDAKSAIKRIAVQVRRCAS